MAESVQNRSDGDLVVTGPDGREARHEILSAIGGRPVTVLREGYDTVGTFESRVGDEGQMLHQLPIKGGAWWWGAKSSAGGGAVEARRSPREARFG